MNKEGCSKSGFTLVELAIVLTIIGLLVGGVLVARSMIETAGIGKLVREISQVEIAFNNFHMNFKTIAGDDPRFVPPGNFSRRINSSSFACAGTVTTNEQVNAFAHLYQAGMIKGPTSLGLQPHAVVHMDLTMIYIQREWQV